MLRVVFLIALPLGLLLGVRAMIVGIARTQQRLRASMLNLPTIGGWLAIFGASGYLLDRYTSLEAWPKVAIAAAIGLAAATGVYIMIAAWAVPGAEREVEDERYILQGHPGSVSRAIASNGVGEISYEHDGQHHVVAARSLDGQAVDAGIDVIIERIEDGVAYVELWSVIEKQLEME